jgi:hypothetical protein
MEKFRFYNAMAKFIETFRLKMRPMRELKDILS